MVHRAGNPAYPGLTLPVKLQFHFILQGHQSLTNLANFISLYSAYLLRCGGNKWPSHQKFFLIYWLYCEALSK